MVSEKKKQTVKAVGAQLKGYTVVGMMNMHKLPARQLHEMRNKLRGKVVIRMVKKRLIDMILKKCEFAALASRMEGEPALLMSKEDPFRIARILQRSTSEAPAREGDIAPKDIIIPAGPTQLSPGPVIGELQKVKIPAGVEGEKIVVKKETLLVKEGEEISRAVADVLMKLNIKPMEIGLNLLAVMEGGTLYGKDILFVPEGHYIGQLNAAGADALNLSVYINYATKETMPFILNKAMQEATSLALQAGFVTPSTIGMLLAKAGAEADAVAKGI